VSQTEGRTPEQLEADIEATRLRLAGTVDAIAERVSPANVAHRALERLKAQVVDDRGDLRMDRIAIIAGVGVALIGLKLWRHR
jgi:Protein of unknown function (DUF3618)